LQIFFADTFADTFAHGIVEYRVVEQIGVDSCGLPRE
jgi:hypothetical protein